MAFSLDRGYTWPVQYPVDWARNLAALEVPVYGGIGCIAFDVFIASPDLPKLRSAIATAIQDWNRQRGAHLKVYLIDRQWEQLMPSLAGPAQERQIDPMVDSSDILIGVLASKMNTKNTLHEIERFLRKGKGEAAIVYLPHTTPDEDPELGQIRTALREHGIVGGYSDEKHLLENIDLHLGQAVKVLLNRADSWTRLCQNLADVYQSAPLPFARLIVNDFLRGHAWKSAGVRLICGQFQTTGLETYKARVHQLVAEAPPSTAILAVCGEKGLGDYEAHQRYFRPFYEFCRNGGQVYRVFVQLKTGGHSDVTSHCIRDHQAAGAIPLEITPVARAQTDAVIPGLCGDLDAGFGAVLFIGANGIPHAVVHAGTDKDLRWAELDPSVPLDSTVGMLRALFERATGDGCDDAQNRFLQIRSQP